MGRIKNSVKNILVNAVAMSYITPHEIRRIILRSYGGNIGHARIFARSIFRTDDLTIGDGTGINHGCYFDSGSIVIGKNVHIGPHTVLVASSHRVGPAENRCGDHFLTKIVIEDGVWIGANVTVLPGVTIASGCIVGAGAVVAHDTEPDGLYLGLPAKRVKDLP